MSTDIKLNKAQLSKIIQPRATTRLATIASASSIVGAIQKHAWKRCCESRKKNYQGHFK